MSTMTQQPEQTQGKQYKLIDLRVDYFFQITILEKASGISAATIAKMEDGIPVIYRTARQVFLAINRARVEKGEPELTMEQMGIIVKARGNALKKQQ